MTVFTEPRLSMEFLVSEAPFYVSRDNITLAAGSGVVQPGTVLGKITNGAATSAVKASGANTGNGTITMDGTTPILANAKPGVYQVRFTSATAYTVNDPTGTQLGSGSVGTAFADRVKFNTAAGGTAFVAGDGFDITIAAGSGKYVPSTASALDGSGSACAINLLRQDATSADVVCAAMTNTCEVVGAMLTYDASVNSPTLVAAKVAQLGALNIKTR